MYKSNLNYTWFINRNIHFKILNFFSSLWRALDDKRSLYSEQKMLKSEKMIRTNLNKEKFLISSDNFFNNKTICKREKYPWIKISIYMFKSKCIET